MLHLSRKAALLLLILAQLACARLTEKQVRVFAASSLRELLTEIKDDHVARSGQRIAIQFESSAILARQIEAGAEAHVLISASPEWIERVRPLERYDWLSNRLVCVAANHSLDVDIKELDSLVLANEKVPVGKYARDAFRSLGIATPKRTIYGSNARDVLTKVMLGAATAGVVYATDAAAEPGVRIVYTFPEHSHAKITYSVGLLGEEGRPFFNRLREPAALQRATRRGFLEIH
ncbi:MAG: molybdate ABC transporter substrate-binding protein [Leptospirales bacterium]|nr:molybdate ABC transporter substrate-binding protein [Leptospirales bacterium]